MSCISIQNVPYSIQVVVSFLFLATHYRARKRILCTDTMTIAKKTKDGGLIVFTYNAL